MGTRAWCRKAEWSAQVTPVVLNADELQALTGYEQPTKQLNILHKRGFTRAFIGRRGVVLERAHYEAVCQGVSLDRPVVKEVNLAFFTKARQ